MDFKSLISKLDSMEAPPKTPAAPELPKAVQLNEDAELRVLAGTSSYIAEAKKKKDEEKKEEVKEEMKVGDKKPSSTGGTIEKTATGLKHHAGNKYGGEKAPKDDEDDDAPKSKKKAKKESVEPEFKSKFMKMVEAKKAEKEEKAKAKKDEKMEEGKGDGNLANNAKPYDKVTRGDVIAGRLGKDEMGGKKKKAGGKNESKVALKKVVAESVEQKLTFKEMMKIVVESGGQQQIDPVDKALFNWAQRVAASKFNEGMKAEVYAGLIYERNGGRFELYDVLSEDQK